MVSGSKPAGEWEGPAIGPVLRHINLCTTGIDFACYPPMPSIFLLNLKGTEKREELCCLLVAVGLLFATV